jgi:CheY-like chemotaxis protein
MDVQMPVMDGLEATRTLRQLPGGSSIPVIALTAGVLTREREEALAAGMNDFATKPIQLKHLQARILRLIRA